MKATGRHTTITYTYLYASAFHSYEVGLIAEEGSFFFNLNSIIMSAFSFEAYMNHCGRYLVEEQLLENWDDFKWKSAIEKFDIISSISKVKIDKSTFPYKSIPELIKLRNALAHGETETIYSEVEINDYNKIRDKLKKPEWENKCKAETAKRFLDDVRAILVLLHKNIFDNNDPFIIMSNGFYGEK
jgi:hypothetical protein